MFVLHIFWRSEGFAKHKRNNNRARADRNDRRELGIKDKQKQNSEPTKLLKPMEDWEVVKQHVFLIRRIFEYVSIDFDLFPDDV